MNHIYISFKLLFFYFSSLSFTHDNFFYPVSHKNLKNALFHTWTFFSIFFHSVSHFFSFYPVSQWRQKKSQEKRFTVWHMIFFLINLFFHSLSQIQKFFFLKTNLIYCVIKIFLQDFKWKIKSVKPTAKKVCQIFILPGQKKFVIRIKFSCMKLDKDTFLEKN